jgi:hypothetical protein
MNRKLAVGVVVVVAGLVAGAAWLTLKKRGEPAVAVTLRIAVSPADQLGFVAARGNSAQFKYLLGKQSGVKPVLAQKLSFKPVPGSPVLEARVGVLTKEEGKRYVEAFLPTLQDLCGKQAILSLAEQSVR